MEGFRTLEALGAETSDVQRTVVVIPLPLVPPTLSDFLRLLTELGGYNNRAKERPAGPLPFWIGLRRMADFEAAWLAFGPDN